VEGRVAGGAGPAQTPPRTAAVAPDPLSLAVVLGLAFLGGLLLNLMPCVLPVLSLKVLGFVRHAGEAKDAWRHGLAFTAGVLLSFWTLAGGLLLLRAGGEGGGWGVPRPAPALVASLDA